MDAKKEEMLQLLDRINQLSNETGFNPFDNYNFRLLGLEKVIRDFEIFSGFEVSGKRTGRDAFSNNYGNIEIKTSKLTTKKITKNSGTLEFDKQNDEIRRKETLEYDALVSAVYENNDPFPVALFIIKSKTAMEAFRDIVKKKQDDFVERWNSDHSQNKRGRDSIQIKINEIIEKIEDNEEDFIFIGDRFISISEYKNNKYFEV